MDNYDEPMPDEPAVDLGSLPREMEPSDLLEERVVRELKGRGLLRDQGSRPLPSSGRRGWIVAATAAALALFLGGMAVGQHQGRRATVELLAAVREADTADRATLVQQTGSLYVTALAALAREEDAAAREPGREAALSALFAAATELARLEPDDGQIARVLQILQEGAGGPTSGESQPRQVIWF